MRKNFYDVQNISVAVIIGEGWGKCFKKTMTLAKKKLYVIGQIGVGLLTQYVSKREAG